jgi:hypothetical protein
MAATTNPVSCPRVPCRKPPQLPQLPQLPHPPHPPQPIVGNHE